MTEHDLAGIEGLNDPQAHEYRLSGMAVYLLMNGVRPTGCTRCGQPPEAHTGAKLPVDQVLRTLGPEIAPRLL